MSSSMMKILLDIFGFVWMTSPFWLIYLYASGLPTWGWHTYFWIYLIGMFVLAMIREYAFEEKKEEE